MLRFSQNAIKICSFDVFDTVLTRIFARPSDLFIALATFWRNDGGLVLDVDTLACYRQEAENQARQVAPAEDITLEMIYAILGETLGLEESQWQKLMHQEIELEKRSVRPVPTALTMIQRARNAGKRVVFISDMYLPTKVVQSMLETCGAFQEGDHLYLSCQIGKTKSTGNLFRYILKQENVIPAQVQHMGDNGFTDVKRAREIGIKAIPFTETHLTRYEQIIAGAAEVSPLMRSLLAGKSRLTRLRCPYEDEHRRVIWATGANVVGPILVGYVGWVLSEARKQGLERLYFLSRDGQILLRIAEIIRQKLNFPIECRYLYGSRQAWHLPAVDILGDFEYSWILAPTDFLSVESVLRRVDLSPGQLAVELTAAGLPPDVWNRNLNSDERERLRVLIGSGRLDSLILQRAKHHRATTVAYLVQEGLFDRINYAIVDVGWGGSLQRSLGKLLELSGDTRPTRGYYFGLLARTGARPRDCLRAYFWDYSQPSRWYDWIFMTRALLEVFTAADHGSVSHYEISDGRVKPVLMAETNATALAWGVRAQQTAIIQLAEELDPEILQDFDAQPAWLTVFARLLRLFYEQPTRAEAQVYAQFIHSEDQNETLAHPLAKPYGAEAIYKALRSRPIHHHHNEWGQAAKILTPRPLWYTIRLIQKAQQWLFRDIKAS